VLMDSVIGTVLLGQAVHHRAVHREMDSGIEPSPIESGIKDWFLEQMQVETQSV
jgi:hypothetical protein